MTLLLQLHPDSGPPPEASGAATLHDPEAAIGSPDDDVAKVVNIQPVIRFTIGDWNLINRTIVPDRVAGARERRQASAVLDQLGAKVRALAPRSAPCRVRARKQFPDPVGWQKTTCREASQMR